MKNKLFQDFQENFMTIQSPTKIISTTNIFEMLISAFFSTNQPASYSPSDFGFEIEESRLAEELSTPLPAILPEQPVQVNPNDFETLFNWFLS
jgi:hypothetical protein